MCLAWPMFAGARLAAGAVDFTPRVSHQSGLEWAVVESTSNPRNAVCIRMVTGGVVTSLARASVA